MIRPSSFIEFQAMQNPSPKSAVDQYIQTGEYDPLYLCFEGQHHLERIRNGRQSLHNALISDLRSLASSVSARQPNGLPTDLRLFTREKVDAMVRGLFKRTEVEVVLDSLENSVVFLTPDTIEETLLLEDPNTAWELASLYLRSIGAEPISEEAQQIVGMSAELKCYVSMKYFTEVDPFDDFVVHEAAHVFHNVKRRTIGLRESPRKEWLLPIVFQKRETFAYACEAYSRILDLGMRPQDRQMHFDQLKQSFCPPDERVDADEYYDILANAITKRNGWKLILERCSES